ncbi:MAG: DUF3656 domain-containing protein [Suilimivivens sp.]
MKKVELLAPAGNYEALVGAIAAGADAVYLGGNAFGARAYADNFSQDEICEGIKYAHTFNKKIYLTVNTLVKEQEFTALYDFLLPLYEAGLDGAIIQDLGVFSFVRDYFPLLELHVSTQMTITGSYGAALLKQEGACRIVPARELSLAEIKSIKEKVDIEIETFIHGAMCYCYSGQCLFSSILGGRSGNRGRCAQPCRLPYHVNSGREQYPLSMKDMCTITILPELMEAGIDSFKIEGRMKKPEYAAGVTAIYRKYIDKYYHDLACGKQREYEVSKEDMEHLKSLYIRSSLSEGYYHQHNDRDMVTLSSPAYSGSDENLLNRIRENYIEKESKLPVSIEALLKEGQAARLTLSCGKAVVSVEGSVVQKAVKQPLSRQKIEEQLQKSGGTCFEIRGIKIDGDENIFLPVSALNLLRREGLISLQEQIIKANGFAYENRKAVSFSKYQYEEYCKTASDDGEKKRPVIHVLVNDREQLQAALDRAVDRIYIDKINIDEKFIELLTSYKEKNHTEFYLAFPYIVRKQNYDFFSELFRLLQTPVFEGALVRNLESIAYLKALGNEKKLVADVNLYSFNRQAYESLKRKTAEVYFPVELNLHEWKDLQKSAGLNRKEVSAMVYGRLPMMISAGCLKKTEGTCSQKSGFSELTDRYQKQFPVYNDCTYCYNIIYNSIPLSLHKLFDKGDWKPGNCRLDFTIESGAETGNVIEYFQKLSCGQYKAPFYQEYTTAHLKRGVE